MSSTRKIFLFVAVPLLVLLGGLATYSLKGSKTITQETTNETSTSEKSVTKTGCQLISPVDVKTVSAILYPGQVRGGDYKPHGGFRLTNTADNKTEVKAVLDAEVIAGSRYLEMGEVQYMFDFKTECGLEYRFDHLKTLSAKLQAIAEKLPEPKADDSRTTNISGVSVSQGEVLATEVGFAKSPDGSAAPNVSFDFGLYDKKQKNAASQDSAWVAAHQEDGDQAVYAVCWLDQLPTTDAATLRALPGGDSIAGKQSDYCK